MQQSNFNRRFIGKFLEKFSNDERNTRYLSLVPIRFIMKKIAFHNIDNEQQHKYYESTKLKIAYSKFKNRKLPTTLINMLDQFNVLTTFKSVLQWLVLFFSETH